MAAPARFSIPPEPATPPPEERKAPSKATAVALAAVANLPEEPTGKAPLPPPPIDRQGSTLPHPLEQKWEALIFPAGSLPNRLPPIVIACFNLFEHCQKIKQSMAKIREKSRDLQAELDTYLWNLLVEIFPLIDTLNQFETNRSWSRPHFSQTPGWKTMQRDSIPRMRVLAQFGQPIIKKLAALKLGQRPSIDLLGQLPETLAWMLENKPSKVFSPPSIDLKDELHIHPYSEALHALEQFLVFYGKTMETHGVLPNDPLLNNSFAVSQGAYAHLLQSLRAELISIEKRKSTNLSKACATYGVCDEGLDSLIGAQIRSTPFSHYVDALQALPPEVLAQEAAQDRLILFTRFQFLVYSLFRACHADCARVLVHQLPSPTLNNLMLNFETLFRLLATSIINLELQEKSDRLSEELKGRDPADRGSLKIAHRWLSHMLTTAFGEYLDPLVACCRDLAHGNKDKACAVFVRSTALIIEARTTHGVVERVLGNPNAQIFPEFAGVKEDIQRLAHFTNQVLTHALDGLSEITAAGLRQAEKASQKRVAQAAASLVRESHKAPNKSTPPPHKSAKTTKGLKPDSESASAEATVHPSSWSEAMIPTLPPPDPQIMTRLPDISYQSPLALCDLMRQLPSNPFTNNFRLLAGHLDELQKSPRNTADWVLESTDLLRRLLEALFHHFFNGEGLPIPKTHNLIVLAYEFLRHATHSSLGAYIIQEWTILSLLSDANNSVNYTFSCPMSSHPDGQALHAYVLSMTRSPDSAKHQIFINRVLQTVVQLIQGSFGGANEELSTPLNLPEPSEHPLLSGLQNFPTEDRAEAPPAPIDSIDRLIPRPRQVRNRDDARKALSECLSWLQLLLLLPVDGARDNMARFELRNGALKNVMLTLERLIQKWDLGQDQTSLCDLTIGVLRLLRRAVKEILVAQLYHQEIYSDVNHVMMQLRCNNNPLTLYRHLPNPRFSPPRSDLAMLHLATHYPYPHAEHLARPTEIEELLSPVIRLAEIREKLGDAPEGFVTQVGSQQIGSEDLNQRIEYTVACTDPFAFSQVEFILQALMGFVPSGGVSKVRE